VLRYESANEETRRCGPSKRAVESRAELSFRRRGLVSTVDDYLAFAKVLLKKGASGKKRLVAESSVEMMTTNHLPARTTGDGPADFARKKRAGDLGFPFWLNRTGWPSKPGRYGWNGGLGSSWWNDPDKGLIAIILTERVFESADPPGVIKDFWKGAYKTAGN